MEKNNKKNNKKNYKEREEKNIKQKKTKANEKEEKRKVIQETLDLEEEIDEDLEEETLDLEEEIDEDLEEEIDEDLEEETDEELEEEKEEVIEKPKIKEIKPKKDKKETKEKIEKIEKIAKEKSIKTKKKENSNVNNILTLLDKYHGQIFTFIAGVLIATLIAFLIWPDRIATLKDGTQPIVKVGGKTYTADYLYNNMKEHYSVNLLIDEIDNDLLTKIYKEDDTMKKKIEENAQYYLNMYKQYYNYTQEEFLEKNGFANYEAFLNYLRLDYRRNMYLDNYIQKNLTDTDIQKYYDENVYGDINTQHVLVEVRTDEKDTKKLSDEDAKKLAEEIITKLNDGTSWETIQKDYKDKITFEDLGYQSWDASLEQSFMTALKGMEDKSYSKEPVKTSYGYHVIYRLDQKKKPELKKVKDKIIEKLVTEKKASDNNILYKALISLRKEKKIKFTDTDMNAKYEAYCKQYQK